MIFRGSIPHPTQSLCTLRNHCRQWPRNTRYQADATPYLGRTSTGWIAPALPGALIRSPRRHSRLSVGGEAQRVRGILRLMTTRRAKALCITKIPSIEAHIAQRIRLYGNAAGGEGAIVNHEKHETTSHRG